MAESSVADTLVEYLRSRGVRNIFGVLAHTSFAIGDELFIPDLPRLAELYGAKGFSVTREEDLKPVFQQALAADEFVVVDVQLD